MSVDLFRAMHDGWAALIAGAHARSSAHRVASSAAHARDQACRGGGGAGPAAPAAIVTGEEGA